LPTKEERVISAVVTNGDIGSIVGENVEIFGEFGEVIEWIKDYYMRYRGVPATEALTSRFDELDLPAIDGPTDYYVEELRESFVKNKIERVIERASTHLETEAPAFVLEKTLTALAKLGQYTTNVRDLDITDVDTAVKHIEDLREQADANDGSPGIATGIKSIDSAYVTGFAPGHSVIIMGYTGRGKSMLADWFATQVWSKGHHPMIISLEMSPEEQAERIYAMMSSGMFRISDLSRGMVNIDDFREWGRRELDKSVPFTIVSNQGVSDITPNVIQAKIDLHRPDFLVLDYLQLMMDNAKTQAMTPRMLNLSREIKMLAVSNNIPILSLTAVTDEDNDKRDSPPVLSQVSWSKGIEYDANLAMAVHRHDESDLVEVVGRKNRHGPMFDFFFEVDFDRGVWTEKFDM
jgi:replicative DNA helicase